MEREAIFISLGRVSFSGETMVIEYLVSLTLGNLLSVGSLPRPVRAACDFVVCSCLLPRLHNLSVIFD